MAIMNLIHQKIVPALMSQNIDKLSPALMFRAGLNNFIHFNCNINANCDS